MSLHSNSNPFSIMGRTFINFDSYYNPYSIKNQERYDHRSKELKALDPIVGTEIEFPYKEQFEEYYEAAKKANKSITDTTARHAELDRLKDELHRKYKEVVGEELIEDSHSRFHYQLLGIFVLAMMRPEVNRYLSQFAMDTKGHKTTEYQYRHVTIIGLDDEFSSFDYSTKPNIPVETWGIMPKEIQSIKTLEPEWDNMNYRDYDNICDYCYIEKIPTSGMVLFTICKLLSFIFIIPAFIRDILNNLFIRPISNDEESQMISVFTFIFELITIIGCVGYGIYSIYLYYKKQIVLFTLLSHIVAAVIAFLVLFIAIVIISLIARLISSIIIRILYWSYNLACNGMVRSVYKFGYFGEYYRDLAYSDDQYTISGNTFRLSKMLKNELWLYRHGAEIYGDRAAI